MVKECLDSADVAKQILGLAERMGAPQIVWSPPQVLGEKEILEHLSAARLKCIRHDIRSNILGIPIGVTGADGGIAETGSVLLNCSLESTRLASCLPSVHLAIVPASLIVPALEDAISLWDMNGARRAKSLWSLISGPSKTKAIEAGAVLGVNGPREMHILIV